MRVRTFLCSLTAHTRSDLYIMGGARSMRARRISTYPHRILEREKEGCVIDSLMQRSLRPVWSLPLCAGQKLPNRPRLRKEEEEMRGRCAK